MQLSAKDIEQLKQRIARRVVHRPNGCWYWATNPKLWQVYPTTKVHGKPVLVRRLIYILLKGPIPNDSPLRAKCNDQYCVNPNHLELKRRQPATTCNHT